MDNPHYLLDASGTHKEPRETKDKMGDDLDGFVNTVTSSCKTWFSGGQLGRPMSNGGHSTAETELKLCSDVFVAVAVVDA